MKVAFSKSIEVESEVTIDIEDITSALQDLAIDVMRDVGSDRHVEFAVRGLLVASMQCLQAVTDEMVARLSPDMRGKVVSALQKQLERYATQVSSEAPRTDLVATFTYKDGSTHAAKAFKSVRGLSRQIQGEYCRPIKVDYSRDPAEVFDFISDRVHIAKLKQWLEQCRVACTPRKGGAA